MCEVPFALSVMLEAVPHQLCLCVLCVFGVLVWSREYDAVKVEEEFPEAWCVGVVVYLFMCR